MRTTGLGFTTFLIALGAVLYWGVTVNTDAEGFNLNSIGIILMIVGAIGFVATMAMAATPTRHEEDTRVVVDERVEQRQT